MKRIYKYAVKPGQAEASAAGTALCPVELPVFHEILRIGEQNGRMFLWAMLDDQQDINATKTVTFLVVPTGMDFDDNGWTFLGTVLMPKDGLVWHVFQPVED